GWTATAEPRASDGDAPYPLFPEADSLASDHHLRTGVYPLHSLIALRADLVARDPSLATALYAAFAEAKRRQLAIDPDWTELPRFARQAAQTGGDPVPYGVAANEPSLAALVRYSRDQGLLDADFPDDPRALFADGDYPDA
ncbi:4,5-dihydroxyphthalate decarboxylase, partial [Streptomyces nodosus]